MAVEGWTDCTVGDIKSGSPYALATGPFGSAISSSHFTDHGVPVLRGGNLSQDVETRLVDEGLVYVSDEKAKEFSRSIARRGDLVFTCWGTIDQVGLVDDRSRFTEYVVSNKQMKLTPDSRKVDSLFLYYLFSGPDMKRRILSQGIGSSVPGFNLGQLRSLPLTLPPLPEQRAIAHILGTLDNKIELNRQIGETLQAIAEALFRSWFVDFDPVHAKAEGRDAGMPADLAQLFPDEFEDSGTGEVPSGWRRATLGDVAVHQRRAVQPNELDPSSPYIGLEHMPRHSVGLTTWATAGSVQSGKTAFRRGEILFGKLRPYFHKVGVAPTDGVCSTDIVVVAPTGNAWFGFVLGHLSSDAFIDYTDAGSTGTKMPRTSWAEMAGYPVALPTDVIAAAFTAQVRPMVERIIAGIHENRALVAIRNSLLPRLVSGKLRAPRILTDREQVSP
jgi:type I restriction enzyme S subunit